MASAAENVQGHISLEGVIDNLIEGIDISTHFPSISNKKFQLYLTSMAEQFGRPEEEIKRFIDHFLYSGSTMEGAAFVRNLNPKQRQKYLEAEFDIMFTVGSIVEGREKDVIIDLAYAKGFAWLKYNEDYINLEHGNINECLFQHNGEVYLNSHVFKADLNMGNTPFFDYMIKFCQEMQGPSNNIETVCGLKSIVTNVKKTKKKGMEKAVKTLSKCLSFISVATPRLEKLDVSLTSEFVNLVEQKKEGKIEVNQIDIDEFTSKILPTNRERQNVLLKMHWRLISFIIEEIAVVEIVKKIIMVNELEKNIGFWGFVILPLLNYVCGLRDNLIAFHHQLFSFPSQMSTAFQEDPKEVLELFVKQFFYKQPKVVKEVIKVLNRCLIILGYRYHVLQAITYDFKDIEKEKEGEDICLNIDRVPAISVRSWPSIASEWIARPRKWPSTEILNKILEDGCLLVPKPYNGNERNETLDWRWSFSKAEMILAQERSEKMSLVYLILKTLFYMYIKVVDYDGQTLPSYLVKTLMMQQCEQQSEDWWKDKSVTECVIDILNKLHTCLHSKTLLHYFIHDINLISQITIELIDLGAAIIQSICYNPLPCIHGVLLQLQTFNSKKRETKDETAREQKVKNLAEMTDDQVPQNSNLPLLIAEFRETIKARELKFKDIEEKQGALQILRKVYEEELSKSLPEEIFQESLQIDPVYKDGDIQFTFSFTSLERELENTVIVTVKFKGSGVGNLSYGISR